MLKSRRRRVLITPFVQNVLTYVGQYWPAYALMLSSIPMKGYPESRRRSRVTRGTALCIEGPAGSGNSFFVQAFTMANPGIRLAHHHHVGSQITRAVRLGIPTIALLRNPVDCVTSRAGNNPHMIGPMYYQWIRFFRAVETLRDSVVIGRFETITKNPTEFIRYVNQCSGTDFCDALPEEEVVFRAMDESFSGPVGPRRRNPNRPTPERVHLNRQARSRIAEHRLAPDAMTFYDKLSQHAR
jgi:hypothetical protein